MRTINMVDDLHETPIPNRGASVGAWIRANALKGVAVGFWLLLVIGVLLYQRSTGLAPLELAASLYDQLKLWIGGTWWGVGIYALIYFLRPLILFPASALTILGGNFYGLWLGVPIVVFAGSLSAVIPYFAGRWLFGNLARNDDPQSAAVNRLQQFTDALRGNPFQTVFIMRLLFLPYDPVSILAGSLKIPFGQFFIATALGNSIGAIPYVAFGASVTGNPLRGEPAFNGWVFLFAGVTMAVSILGSRLIKRRRG
jgi:uncharacterized membrane protein YdjX (TVP38/TMEM64 family)